MAPKDGAPFQKSWKYAPSSKRGTGNGSGEGHDHEAHSSAKAEHKQNEAPHAWLFVGDGAAVTEVEEREQLRVVTLDGGSRGNDPPAAESPQLLHRLRDGRGPKAVWAK